MSAADPLITVCRDPRDSARARVRLSSLDGFDFDAFTDGARVKFARPMLVAHMAPASIVDGKIARPASHGPMPDRVKVAITRTHNQTVYPVLERMAAAHRIARLAPSPRQRTRTNPPAIPTRICAPVMPVVPTTPRAPRARSSHEAAPSSIQLDVAAIRVRSGLQPLAFADRIGVSMATLYAWEAGRRLPRAENRERLYAMVSAPF